MTSYAQTWKQGDWSVPHFAVENVSCNCRYFFAQYGGLGSIATLDVCESMDHEWGDDVGPDQTQAKANARRIARVPQLERIALAAIALLDMNENHSPFGGEMYQDRVDRAWDSLREAIK